MQIAMLILSVRTLILQSQTETSCCDLYLYSFPSTTRQTQATGLWSQQPHQRPPRPPPASPCPPATALVVASDSEAAWNRTRAGAPPPHSQRASARLAPRPPAAPVRIGAVVLEAPVSASRGVSGLAKSRRRAPTPLLPDSGGCGSTKVCVPCGRRKILSSCAARRRSSHEALASGSFSASVVSAGSSRVLLSLSCRCCRVGVTVSLGLLPRPPPVAFFEAEVVVSGHGQLQRRIDGTQHRQCPLQLRGL